MDRKKKHEDSSPERESSAKKKVLKYDFLKFPPQSQEEFKAILLEYMNSDLFRYPTHF
jgi:hypothetical protein